MPLRKRTDHSKRASTSPSASTSHTPGDQHHRLRHTGPSIGTQPSVGSAPAKPSATHDHADTTPESPQAADDSKEKKTITSGTRTPLIKFLYVLLISVLLLFGWYIYGMVTLVERLKEEVGWWGILVGDSRGMATCERCAGGAGSTCWSRKEAGHAEAGKEGELQVEGSLNALADALGISPKEVASAVKPIIPQASLTSIASKSGNTGSSEAVRILFEHNDKTDAD